MNAPANIQLSAPGSSPSLRRGLTLVELVISILIAGIMMVSLFAIYSHARMTADGISQSLDKSELPDRILQLIAQDVDRLCADTDDLIIQPELKSENGLVSSRLYLQSQIYDSTMKPVPYERIIWETRYDSESQSMILYRSHSGLVSEDNLLESQRTAEEARAFVPLCSGLTYFKITRIPTGGFGLPNQLIVSLSFAEPEKEGGENVIPPEQIVTRTIAANRLRKIGYIFTEPNLAEPGNDGEPNAPADANAPADTADPAAGGAKTGPATRPSTQRSIE
jgi:prepilin-type N-terminal cleavage/methylation domain-containing protein